MEILKEVIKSLISEFARNPKFYITLTVFIIIALLIDLYYPKIRGFMGEFWAKLELFKLSKKEYIVLNDIMIKDENGTHQIDHIVLSKFGIFVIEMKNYYGLIKGKEFDAKCCQYLGRHKSYFINPIHQNYGHIKTLSSLLKLEEDKFISIICFSNQAELDIKSNAQITQVDYLQTDILMHDDLLIDDDINNLATAILANNIKSRKLRKKHVEDIHTKIYNNKKLEDNMICPKCGNKLIHRRGKYGPFIGCTNYPKCKYIKK